jgi:hypothetical protein
MAKILVLSPEPCTTGAATNLDSGSLSLVAFFFFSLSLFLSLSLSQLLSYLFLLAALFSFPLGFSLLYFFLSLGFEW